ncbi:MAG TPA: hypothetical protein VKN99_10295 [Polyangia bacterium]|nr:hypothetical protein [Polyangia bacterium]
MSGAGALTGVVAKPLERVPVRTRDSEATLSGWRLEVTSDQGAGAIVLVELSPQESCYRGEGAFLGWPQARLAEAYQALTKPAGESAPDLELLQLG